MGGEVPFVSHSGKVIFPGTVYILGTALNSVVLDLDSKRDGVEAVEKTHFSLALIG